MNGGERATVFFIRNEESNVDNPLIDNSGERTVEKTDYNSLHTTQTCVCLLAGWGTFDVTDAPLLDAATRFAFACILKHCGLLPVALQQNR